MRKAVDAEQLLDWCQEAEGPRDTPCSDWYDAFQKMIYRIQEVSVEVPDVPDVLGEFREWLETERGSWTRGGEHDGHHAGDSVVGILNVTLNKLAELQAKKES